MAQMQKVEGEVEVKCSVEKLFEIFAGKQHHIIPNICSDKICGIEAQQCDWVNVGTTRKWSCVIDGKSQELVERLEAVDEKNRMIHRTIIDCGEMMNTHYKTMATKMQVIPIKGGDFCLVKVTIEYEKLNEDAPEPHQLLHFSLGVLEDLGSHLANA